MTEDRIPYQTSAGPLADGPRIQTGSPLYTEIDRLTREAERLRSALQRIVDCGGWPLSRVLEIARAALEEKKA